ncbi:MlaD family protein [Algibacter luteus]|uniref:Phospholipid/cholesterol/gamma-HCH transport system substrate-binding protein n=1 Tax=Algibacter luteus TaxID=1178825 RepID=A0A1M6EMG0_9FLAO|nr:MlaD family protein [Algibacter luteus]SHI86430.1 phospholipid/cholesterol/gamma-HCH transport system substrate-binding protein [Algibacter luteus]
MRKTNNEKLKLGIFVIIGLILFVLAVYFIGNRQNMFAKTFTISANFNNVNGLMQGNNVRYSGINIGTVKAISMINDSTINVNMVIEEKMVQHIKKNAIATIGTDGLVGNMIVNIIPSEGKADAIAEGDVINTYTKIGTGEMLNTLNVTNENAALLTAKLLNIADAMADSKGTFGMLINDTIVSNNLKQTVNQLRIMSIEANKSMRSLNAIINDINFNESVAGVLLNDSLEAQKVRDVLTNLETSTDDIKTVINNLNETIADFKNGKGAVNYLIDDEEFVENLEQTIKNIKEGTDKFNQNMEAFKHNFLTRGYFRKLERQQKKIR